MKKLYYRTRDNVFYTKHTKQEIHDFIDPYNKSTFLFLLHDMDYPFIEKEWDCTLKSMIKNNRDLKWILGKYIAKMRLCSYKYFRYEDGDFLNENRKC